MPNMVSGLIRMGGFESLKLMCIMLFDGDYGCE